MFHLCMINILVFSLRSVRHARSCDLEKYAHAISVLESATRPFIRCYLPSDCVNFRNTGFRLVIHGVIARNISGKK
jgi:hypothetical protein